MAAFIFGFLTDTNQSVGQISHNDGTTVLNNTNNKRMPLYVT